MDKCRRCKEVDIEEISTEDMQDGFIDNEGLCSDCSQEEHEFENTCPIHHCYCLDGFCEYCIIESIENNKEDNGLPPTSKEVGIRPTIL